MYKILAAVLLAPCCHATASQWQMLATRNNETVIYFTDIERKADMHTLIWVKTVFTISKSVAIEGNKRIVVENHSMTMSGWDIDCANKSGSLTFVLPYTTDGKFINDFAINSFAFDFLGGDAKPIEIVEITYSKQLVGNLKNSIVDRACQGGF